MSKIEIVYYPAPAELLGPEELLAAFARIGRNDAVWQALMQLLQQRLADAVGAATGNEPNAAGRIEEIVGLQQQLMAFRKQGTDGAPRKRGA